jgi:hypothetical protein
MQYLYLYTKATVDTTSASAASGTVVIFNLGLGPAPGCQTKLLARRLSPAAFSLDLCVTYPALTYMLHCPIRLPLQNTRSKIKLLRIHIRLPLSQAQSPLGEWACMTSQVEHHDASPAYETGQACDEGPMPD